MAIIKNELNVVQGFGERQMVFDTVVEILHGQFFKIVNGLAVLCDEDVDDVGMVYVAQNDTTNTDANASPDTFINDGVHDQVVGIPVVSNNEVEIPTEVTFAVGELIAVGVDGAIKPAAGAGLNIGYVTAIDTNDGIYALLIAPAVTA